MLFHYKALDSTGKEVEANLEAKDRFALYHAVKKDGNTVIFTEEVKAKGRFSLIKLLPFLDNVTAHDKIIFARNLSRCFFNPFYFNGPSWRRIKEFGN